MKLIYYIKYMFPTYPNLIKHPFGGTRTRIGPWNWPFAKTKIGTEIFANNFRFLR